MRASTSHPEDDLTSRGEHPVSPADPAPVRLRSAVQGTSGAHAQRSEDDRRGPRTGIRS